MRRYGKVTGNVVIEIEGSCSFSCLPRKRNQATKIYGSGSRCGMTTKQWFALWADTAPTPPPRQPPALAPAARGRAPRHGELGGRAS
jgi:hypothetical protein